MFFGQLLKPGCQLKVADACKKAEYLTLTSACLSADSNGSASLMVHTPSGQRLSLLRLSATTRYSRIDLTLPREPPGFTIESVGGSVDVAGFTEPTLDEELAGSVQVKQLSAAASGTQEKPSASATLSSAALSPKKAVAQAPAAASASSKKDGISQAKAEAETVANQPKDFIPAKTFAGAKPGMVFKKGKQGLGYYKDTYIPPKGLKRKAEDAPAVAAPPTKKTLPGGMRYEVMKSAPGSASKASRGRKVQVRYEGRLAANGRRFDKGTIQFKLGAGEVIKGWDIGVDGMAIGEKRRLFIPSGLAYGRSGAPPDIPPNATLTFEVELLRVN